MSKAKEVNKAPENGGWGIHIPANDGKTPRLITNFRVEVVSLVEVFLVPETKAITHVKLKIHFEDDESEEFLVPLTDIDKIKWPDKDIECWICPDTAPSRAERYITIHVREKIPGADKEKEYWLPRVGVYEIEGEFVYCTGAEVLRPPRPLGAGDKLTIKPVPMPYNLDYDPTLTEQEAVAEMFELISLFPDVGRILLAYNFLYFMRGLYVYAWKAPQFCLYLCGETASLKTTISAFFCQLYNRAKDIKSPPRVDSSIPYAASVLCATSDSVIVFDDLYPVDEKAMQRYMENTLREIVRIHGDGVQPGRVKGLDIEMPPPESGVVLTAEYLLTLNESSMARLLPIDVAPPSHETLQQLAKFQEKDKLLMISTVYRNFIQYFINNYDSTQESLKKWWDAYKELDFAEQYGMKVHQRLKQTHYYLNTAYVKFLEYCFEIGCITEDERTALHQDFLVLLTDLVLAQQVRVDECKNNNIPAEKFDGLAYIRNLLTSGKIKLAPSAKEFNAAVHDGVEHLNRLYIHSDRFREFINAANANLNEVLDDLKAKGALHHENDARTAQLVVGKKKRRCYAIKLSKLK